MCLNAVGFELEDRYQSKSSSMSNREALYIVTRFGCSFILQTQFSGHSPQLDGSSLPVKISQFDEALIGLFS